MPANTNLPVITGLFQNEPANAAISDDWLKNLWDKNLANGYNFTLINLARDASSVNSAELNLQTYNTLPHGFFTRKAHKSLSAEQWHSVGGMITNLPAEGVDTALASIIFNEAAQWAKYLGMHSITFNLGKVDDSGPCNVLFYAGLIREILHRTLYEGFHIWIKTPHTDAGWCTWNVLRNSIGETAKNRLHVVLDMQQLDKNSASWDATLQRWYGESIQAISLPTPMFDKDHSGAAVLPAPLQSICLQYFLYPHIKWLIEGPCLHKPGYFTYRDHLEAISNRYHLSALESFLRPSLDQLQRPMQPLQDQLQSSNYALFEQDPVKYVQYEKAIRQALEEHHNNNSVVTVMVLGAGRGPLVDVVLRAARSMPCQLKLFVIEKNPTAVVTLRHRSLDDWHAHDITVIETDMRDWDSPELADIIVSELLGSWGDNELSPECLDGANHLLKPSGISIPAAYTSYLRPLSSARLYTAAAACAPYNFPQISSRSFLESTYVVCMGSVYYLADEQPCFTFEHPNTQAHSNERHARCSFTMPVSLSQCIMHGFRGTFDCLLYGEHRISIAVSNHSDGMFCWFPLFIPLEQPLTLEGGETIHVDLWRKTANNKVWYEWKVENKTHLHNAGGRSSTLGLTAA